MKERVYLPEQAAKTTLFAAGNEATGPLNSLKNCRPAIFQRMEAARTSSPPAPDITATVAPFRAWRDSRLVVAEKPVRATMDWALALQASCRWPAFRGRRSYHSNVGHHSAAVGSQAGACRSPPDA